MGGELESQGKRRTEQGAAKSEHSGSSAISEEPEVTDAHQALGQNME
jgi:hypothetical protein